MGSCSTFSFAPADPTTGAADEAVQVARPGPTLPLRPRWDQQLVLPPPRSPPCPPVSSRPDPGLPDLGRGHRRGRRGIAVSVPGLIACIVAATLHQVDGASRGTPPHPSPTCPRPQRTGTALCPS